MARKTKMGALLIFRAIIRAIKPICARVLPLITESLRPASYYFAGALGFTNALCNIQGFYRAYIEKKPRQQQKARMTNHAIAFSLNTIYSVAAFSQKLIPYRELTFINVTNNSLALACFSYILYQGSHTFKQLEEATKNARKNNSPEIDTLEKNLKCQRFSYFKNKVDVTYSASMVISNSIFVAGYFFPILGYIGVGTLSVQTMIELYDRNTDLKFSRWLTGNLKLIDDNPGNTHNIHQRLALGNEQVISPALTETLIQVDNEYQPLPDNATIQNSVTHASSKHHSNLFFANKPANDSTQEDCNLGLNVNSGTP